jgi:hypothetical protein
MEIGVVVLRRSDTPRRPRTVAIVTRHDMTYPFVDRRQTDETRVRLVHQLHIPISESDPLCAKHPRTHLEAYDAVQIPYRLDQPVNRFEKGVLKVVLDVDLPPVLAFDVERWRKGFTAPEECAAESARAGSPRPSELSPSTY